MTKKSSYFTVDDFYETLDKKDASELLLMLRGGVLYHIEETDTISVLKKLLAVRNMDVLAEASRHINYFQVEMLEDLDLTNYNNRAFLGIFLSKYVSKFQYKDNETAGTLFAKACISESIPAIRFLMKKGVGESQYPRIISSSAPVRKLLSEVKTSALSKDTISTFFMEAALAEDPEERIHDLMRNGFDIKVINSDGLNVVEAFRKGLDAYAYPKNKLGTLERQNDESSLKVLERVYSEV